MDERHWWIAGKIQESFHIGGYDNPTLLEDFLCEQDTLALINEFLSPGGLCRLFFYCEKPESGIISTRQLHIANSISKVKVTENISILYFLRHHVSNEVDPTHMERDVFCGEIKGGSLENFSTLLSEIYVPLLKSQKDWGECTPDHQASFMHSIEKFMTSFVDASSSSHSSRQWILKQPDSSISAADFRQHRLAALDQQVIAEYEQLVSDWISTIETILADNADERFLDPFAGPLTELDRWRRRQRLLTSLTEQLKSKECKAIIHILITAKSRLLKKWKIVDSWITDAVNETKDKVRYLDSMKRPIDLLYRGATPSSMINIALPGILTAIKQFDSVSRYYARQGFLGLFFVKITNQLVLACKEHLQEMTTTLDNEDLLWSIIMEEMDSYDNSASSADPQPKHFSSQLDARLKGARPQKESRQIELNEETLLNRMKACLILQNHYRDWVRAVKDSLGASHGMSHGTSQSSIDPGASAAQRKLVLVSPAKNQRGNMLGGSKRGGSSMGDENYGVSVADEETIMQHLDSFCSRIKHMLDIITTLAQFNKIVGVTAGLPRPRKEDMVYEESEEEQTRKPEQEEQEMQDEDRHHYASAQDIKLLQLPKKSTTHELGVITETDEQVGGDGDSENAKDNRTEKSRSEEHAVNKHVSGEEMLAILNTGSKMSRLDVQLLKKYYPDHLKDEGPSVMSVIQKHMDKVNNIVMKNITTKLMLDVETKEKSIFEENYTAFKATIQDLENFIGAYLNALFVGKMKTKDALSLLDRFVPIQTRAGVKVAIAEKFIEIFSWYESDLEEIQDIYEKYKDLPPLARNAPPAAGAIYWSRQLLRRIEEPMQVFQLNKAVTQLKDFSRVVKLYNRLAMALVTFESLWLSHWKSSIEYARRGISSTLLVLHPHTKAILVNADEKVLELIEEAKHLTRLGIEIPESAKQVLHQESCFKRYKDHLELCISDFTSVCGSIPPALLDLFQNHIDKARINFQPGLNTLSWNSMNIDAFLHQIHTGISKLKTLVDSVNKIMREKVECTIEAIRDMIFFDYKLAFSQAWPPSDFSSVVGESVNAEAVKLYSHVAVIEEGIIEVVNILTGKKIAKKIREPTFSTQTNITANTEKPEYNMIVKLHEHYCDQIYEAILLATTRSLVTLAESSGCEAEVIHAASALSDAPSSRTSTPRVKSASTSRVTSAACERSRPVSVLSLLSNMTWTTDLSSEVTYLRFEVLVKFNIPNIIIEPTLESIQTALSALARQLLTVPKGIVWTGTDNLGEKFMSYIEQDDIVNQIMNHITGVIDELETVVKQHLFHFGLYEFLWKDDMQGNYEDFIQHEPGMLTMQREVERLLRIEQKVLSIPKMLPVRCICINTGAISNALHGFSMVWKTRYASVIREQAKNKLDAAVQYRVGVQQRLEMSVVNLDQLNSTLHLLEEVRDMENKIDAIYLPIESMYQRLQEFELRLPRDEVQEVDALRDKWQDLLQLAESVRTLLLVEQRGAFEQELDKQVKTFVVEVIQFRNAFDAQGPAVPGVAPSEAVQRLENFQHRYLMYETKRKTLDSVSKLFGIPVKPFTELDKTGEELELWNQLYGLFQKFILFDKRFRDTLWADVDLEEASTEVESYWDECLALPSKLKDWDAYNDMKYSIQFYLDVFPLLRKLASKEIRNRHWLQVMSVAGSTFQLEANVFKLHHLLDIGLIKHRPEIEEICYSASRELELEIKLRMTEEEWTEQVLNFEQYKRRGPMYLDKQSAERLLEQLEDAQALLAQMLTSRYIGPLREEAASWAEKLKEVAQVLEQWLEVQDLWQYLEAVFSNPETAKELPQEAKRFSQTDKVWTKMMKRAYDTRNVLQSCYGGEVPKSVVLQHIYEELEVCFKSLLGYLDNKRRIFPRFYFVSDPILLAVLSRPNDLDSVRPHLRSLFSSVYDVQLEKMVGDHDWMLDEYTPRDGHRSISGRSTPHFGGSAPPTPKIDKRLAQVQDDLEDLQHPKGLMSRILSVHPGMLAHISALLPSEEVAGETVTMEAVSISSNDGEYLQLQNKVALRESVETWLLKLRESISQSIYNQLSNILLDISAGVPPEDWGYKYPSQVCTFGLLYMWTRDCEQGVADMKYDRKALHNTQKKFSAATNKVSVFLAKGYWRTYDESMTAVQKQRMENMVNQSIFLRDLIDNMTNRKLRETTDFEWRRCLRVYVQDQASGEQPVPVMHMLDHQYMYGCEFYGGMPTVGLTPLTDKCYLSMMEALRQNKGAMLKGGTGAGKTETVKGLAHILGKFLIMFECHGQSDPAALGRLLQGIAMDGSWACIENVFKLSRECMSIMLDRLQAIYAALQSRQEFCMINTKQEISINSQLAVFITTNDDALPSDYLSSDIRSKFRQVALIKPDLRLLLKGKCSSLGFKAPSVLALRLKLVCDMVTDLLPDEMPHGLSLMDLLAVLQRVSQQRRNVKEDRSSNRPAEKVSLEKRPTRIMDAQDAEFSRPNSQMSMTTTTIALATATTGKSGKKSNTAYSLTAAAKQEHAAVGLVLFDMVGPRLAAQNLMIFKTIVGDVFRGLPDVTAHMRIASAVPRSQDLETCLLSAAEEAGLVLHRPWMDKCVQLHSISQAQQGVIVAGPPGSGKSTVIQGLVDALCKMSPRPMSCSSTPTKELTETNHKLQKLYPLVVDDLSLMYGYLTHNGDWVDGIFTSAWRKAARNMCTTWLCLDGPLNASWVENLSSALNATKTFSLANGDKLFLSDNIKLIFETDDLNSASPSVVSRTGILYVDKSIIGWRPVARVWLENRNQQENHVLQRAFDKTVEPISQYVITECKCKLQLSEVGMFDMCLKLLSAMLADNIEIGGELHIERLYLFCVMWSYGGLLEDKDRKGFNELLSTLSTALPDDDRDIDFFDYYVDESGEWDHWNSRVPDSSYKDQQDFLGEIFVETVNTIRTRMLIELSGAGGQNVLLVGPHGSGKTTMVSNFLQAQDSQLQVMKHVIYSGSSNAQQLQHYVESNIYHRQGFVYGAKDGRKIALLIDDLNLPMPDCHGVQRSNELLRRLLDDKILCTLERPFEWRLVQGLQVFSTMSMNDCPNMTAIPLPARLLRHFAVIQLSPPQDEALQNIVYGILESNMLANDQPGLDIELHSQLVEASCKLLLAVKAVLHSTHMPGRHHYLFSLKDLVTCFQCLRRIPDETRADKQMVVSLWRHEIQHIMMDRVCRHADHLWLQDCISDTVRQAWPDLADQLHTQFVTFSIDARSYNRPVNSVSKKDVKVILQPIDSVKDVHACLQTHLDRYNEEFGNSNINVMLSDNVLRHLINMHRILSFHTGGNFVLVGPIGAHLATLVRLALHVAEIPVHQIDTSKQSNFLDGLRSAVRLTGAEGKVLSLLFTAGRDLTDDSYLDAINSLLVSGEYPHLFSNDEMDGLLQALLPVLKREYPTVPVTNLNKFFVSRVKANLHIIICLPPSHKLITLAPSQYPGLLTGSQLIWMADWTQNVLIEEAAYYLDKYAITDTCETDIREKIIGSLASIHSFMLEDCKQTKWAGEMSDEIQLVQTKINDKKKDQLKNQLVTLPNRPYSKAIMMENIRMRHRYLGKPVPGEMYVGPTTYYRFMNTFRHIYAHKARERTETVDKLKRVLQTIDETRTNAKSMKESIRNINKNYELAKIRTAELLTQLTEKATIHEKLKAKLGIANALSAFLQLNELSDEEDESDDLLKQDERDEYDDEFERRREANLKTRQIQAKEEYAQAIKTVEDCRKKLAYAKQQVTFWKSKVDRPTVERVRGFISPPLLVGQVMEMVMVLIGKRLPNRLEVKETYPSRDEQSGRFSTSSGSTKYTISTKKGKDSNERFERSSWKSMQVTMSDSAKFVDMLHNVPWEDGLPLDVVEAVEEYLAISKDGQLGVTGEGTLLENAAEKEKSLVPIRRSPSPENTRGISIAAAKYSSEDVATLVQYTIAIVEYTRLCGPLKTAMERSQELHREIEENERLQKEKENKEEEEEEEKREIAEVEEELSEEDLPGIQQQVEDLQQQFDTSVIEKYSMEIELQSMKERLKTATDMLSCLKSQESMWKEYVKEHENNDMLVANCVAAAAFLVYAAPMNTDSRDRIGAHFLSICEKQDLPLSSKPLFRETEMFEFLYKPVEICELEQMRLPMTRLMMENATFILQGENTEAWPLLLDPTSRCITWLQQYLGSKGLVEVKYHELKSQFDTCLADGLPLLVTDCNVQELAKDLRFIQVIHSRSRFIPGKNPFKIPVGDHEVEVRPHFRLYLHTTSLPHEVPPEIGAYLSMIYFHATRNDVQQELLDRFMAKEKSRLEDEKVTLLQEGLEILYKLDKLDAQMVDCLASDVRLLEDLSTTKKLAELLKNHEETQESQRRVESGLAVISRAKESFQEVALRGSVLFNTMQYMREVNPLYQISFSHFLDIYDRAIAQSDRAAMKVVIERLTYSAYTATVRSLTERDKFLYALLLALEVEDAAEHVSIGEREFLISPVLGSAIMTAAGYTQLADSKIVTAKKPFDWMTDDQFNNLQILAIHFEWFQEMFDRMPKDGRETQWRNLCENEQPELQPFPDRMHESYTWLQWLLVIRAVRSDRLLQAAMIFITNILGKKYTGDSTVDLMGMLKQSTPTTPLLLMYTNEKESAEKIFFEFANKKQTAVVVVSLSGTGHREEKTAKKKLHRAMADGQWILLHNAHHAPGLLVNLETIMSEVETVDANFRCWISAGVSTSLPVRLLQNSVKVTIDTSRTLRDTIHRGLRLTWMAYSEADAVRQSSKSEWAPFLHNLCFLHGALRLRARFGSAGWKCPQDFLKIENSQLSEAITLSIQEFRDNLIMVLPDGSQMPRNTSWNGIRFMLAEVIYGNYITDPVDQQCLAAMIDYWISPTSVKKDFEVSKLRYKLPPAFFAPNVRLGQLLQAVEAIPWNSLEVPEACSMHTSPEMVLGEEQYILSHLNKIYDTMPSSYSLSHDLFPKPPNVYNALEVNVLVKDRWEDLLQQNLFVNNSHIITDSALMRIHGYISSWENSRENVTNAGVFASASYTMLHMRKEVELWEVCHNMLSKVPRAYNKEYVCERIKKIGGNTPFNLYIMKELSIMFKLLTEIRSTLQSIKAACEVNSMGDVLSEDALSAADDLYHMRIPTTWCALAGNTAPPSNHSLANWLTDLQNRVQHFERILAYGREKMPSYFLGAFFHPRGLLALMKQEHLRQHATDRSGYIDQFVFQTEITARDKDHIRDPPSEGIFIYGIYLWGSAWEKTTGELLDNSPRQAYSQLPVIHLTCWPQGEKPLLQDSVKAAEVYQCPVYNSRHASCNPVLELDLHHSGIPASRWALRGLSATIRPF